MKKLEDYTVRDLRLMYPGLKSKRKSDMIDEIELIVDDVQGSFKEDKEEEVKVDEKLGDADLDQSSSEISRSKNIHFDPWGKNI